MKCLLQITCLIASLSTFNVFISCNGKSKGQLEHTLIDSPYNRMGSTNTSLVDSSLFYKGETIFKNDCNKCHVTKGRLHNYLEGVVERVGIDYLKLYLTKQDSLVSNKDSNALRLKEVWGRMGNSHNFKYSTEELNAIIEYLK